jgi:hypothetical protein
MIQSDNNEIGFARHLLIMISGETVGNQSILRPDFYQRPKVSYWPDSGLMTSDREALWQDRALCSLMIYAS